MAPLRTIFFGTAELAAVSLARLAAQPFIELAAVVSQPDKPRGRDLRLQPTPVKVEAARLAVPVRQPRRCREETFLAELRSLAPELIVVVAYGQILPPAILELPRLGCLNVHASLLPRHRGAAPIQWAILTGDVETGVTIMKMDAGLDTGAMLAKVATPIRPDDDAATVHDRLAGLGADLLVATLPGYAAGRVPAEAQAATGITYARKITREDGRVDWSQPALTLGNRARAFTPWPGTFTFLEPADFPERRLLKLWRVEPLATGDAGAAPGTVLEAAKDRLTVACGRGALRVLELQREGGRRRTTAEFLAGCPLRPGMRFGPSDAMEPQC